MLPCRSKPPTWQYTPPSPHRPNKFLKQIETVLRPGARLGVILHAERRTIGQLDPAIAAVEQGNVSFPCVSRQITALDCEAVVHRRNLDPPVGEALDRVVGAAVALEHLRRLPADRQCEHLM